MAGVAASAPPAICVRWTLAGYNPRHPERTLLYQTVTDHDETRLEVGQFDGQGDHHSPRPFVRQAFEKYLECGIFAHGFACLPVRNGCCRCQSGCVFHAVRWLGAEHGAAHILARHCANPANQQPWCAAHANKAALHIGAVAFIHRLGSSLNGHVYFHVCVVDGVFEAVVGEASEQRSRTTATSAMFHPATGIACARMWVVLAQAYRQR